MRVDAHVTRRARQAFVFPIRYVLVRLQVYVLLGQPEVDDVNDLLPLGCVPSYQEVLRLDVTVDQVPTVNVLYPMELRKVVTFNFYTSTPTADPWTLASFILRRSFNLRLFPRNVISKEHRGQSWA